MATNDRTLKYLKRALTLDPYSSGADIVRLRGKYHRIAAPDDVRVQDDAEEFHNQRMAAYRRVAALRCEIWSVPLALLKSSLAGVDVRRFPDLKPLVERLLRVAEVRDELRCLGKSDPDSHRVWDLLRDVLVAEGNVANAARMELERLWGLMTHNKPIVNALNHLLQLAPKVYELEQELFEALRRKRPSAVTALYGAAYRKLTEAAEKEETRKTEVRSLKLLAVVGLLLGILRIVIGVAGRSTESPPPRPPAPIPTVSYPAPQDMNPPVYDPSLFVPSPAAPESTIGTGPPPNIGGGFPAPTTKPRGGTTQEQLDRLEAMHKRIIEGALRNRNRPSTGADHPGARPQVPDFTPRFPGSSFNPPTSANPAGTPAPGSP